MRQAENTQDEPASGLTVNNDDTGFSPDYIFSHDNNQFSDIGG